MTPLCTYAEPWISWFALCSHAIRISKRISGDEKGVSQNLGLGEFIAENFSGCFFCFWWLLND